MTTRGCRQPHDDLFLKTLLSMLTTSLPLMDALMDAGAPQRNPSWMSRDFEQTLDLALTLCQSLGVDSVDASVLKSRTSAIKRICARLQETRIPMTLAQFDLDLTNVMMDDHERACNSSIGQNASSVIHS